MSAFRTLHRRTDDGIREPVAGARRSAAVPAAWMAAGLLCVIAAFHAALVLGAPWGELTQGGGTSGSLTTSGRIVAAVSCVLAMVMAGAIVGRVGQGPFRPLSSRVKTVLAWFTTVYAVVGVVLNLITRSTAERNLWAPVSILLLGLITFVMVTSRHHDVARDS
jgi:hypothetical protein